MSEWSRVQLEGYFKSCRGKTRISDQNSPWDQVEGGRMVSIK